LDPNARRFEVGIESEDRAAANNFVALALNDGYLLTSFEKIDPNDRDGKIQEIRDASVETTMYFTAIHNKLIEQRDAALKEAENATASLKNAREAIKVGYDFLGWPWPGDDSIVNLPGVIDALIKRIGTLVRSCDRMSAQLDKVEQQDAGDPGGL
jgi:hypothetical protein